MRRRSQELRADEASGKPVLLRRKRMAQPEKNTCQLFIQTDHLFYKYYKTREAVIAQVTLEIARTHARTHATMLPITPAEIFLTCL